LRSSLKSACFVDDVTRFHSGVFYVRHLEPSAGTQAQLNIAVLLADDPLATPVTVELVTGNP